MRAVQYLSLHAPQRTLRRYWLLLTALCLCGGVLPSPAHAGLFSISPSKERKMGEDAAREIEAGSRIVSGPVAEWVEAVGSRLAAVSNPEFEYSFKVIDSPEINAFALPGGHIYVFTGLRKVATTDDELAAVLAHEITHAEEHHFARQYKKSTTRGIGLAVLSAVVGLPNVAQQVLGIMDFAMTQKYSRTHESQADEMGMQRMARAGFNPQGMVTLLDRLAKEDSKGNTLDKWFGNHPDSKNRVEDAKRETGEISSLQAQKNPLVSPRYPAWNGEPSFAEIASYSSPSLASCLPDGIKPTDVVSVTAGGDDKITVAQKLGELKARCANGKLLDVTGKEIYFYRMIGCWGNPPADYQELLKKQQAEIEQLSRKYTVVQMTCNPEGALIQSAGQPAVGNE